MPIVLPRLRISYMYERTEKLLSQYDLTTETIISNGVENDRQRFVREQASNELISQVEEMKVQQQQLTDKLKLQVAGNHDNEMLIERIMKFIKTIRLLIKTVFAKCRKRK